MKDVSNEYKVVMNQVVRPTSKFRASLEMIDRSIESDATVTAPEEIQFSTGVFDKVHECDYLTFEKDLFKLGSDMRISPDSHYLKNGYVSSVMCDENGVFSETPIIEFVFKRPRSFVAMSYEFACAYPRSIRVTYYLSGVQRGQFISMPDGLVFVDSENHISDCDRITFEFLEMSEPYRRLRIARLVFGYEKQFTMQDIISTDHTLSIDPISSSLPYTKLSMKVINQSKDYNPDNPHGAWVYFTNGQPLSVYYGVAIGDKTEWVEAAHLLLSDAPTVDGTSATFEAVDILSTLTDTYYRGVWREGGMSLYDLAIEVLSDVGITDYILSDSLKDIVTLSPLPMLPHRECLQLIANAGGCILYVNNRGTIVIEEQTHDEEADKFYLDFTKMFDKPVVKKTEKLKSVDVTVHSLYVDSAESELCKHSDVKINGTSEIQVVYDRATNVRATVEGGELLSALYYAGVAFLVISAETTVNVTVSGNKIIDDASIIVTTVDDKGEVCPLDNPLITNRDRAKTIGEWVAAYLESRNCYDANFRQDFALDVNDVILIKSDFEDNIPARITKLQYKLPGQTGSISVRRLG